MRQCRSGGAAGGKLEEGVKQMADQMSGSQIAAADAVREAKEATRRAEEAERENKKLLGELEVSRAKRVKVVTDTLEGAHFTVGAVEVGRNAMWWVWTLLFVLWCLNTVCAVVWGVEYEGMERSAFGRLVAVAIMLVSLFCCYMRLTSTRETVPELEAQFMGWLPDPEEDRRHDAHSLQKLKHALPLMSQWRLARGERSEVVYVSGELFLQLLSGPNLSYVADAATVRDRLFRAAVGNQTVNVPREFIRGSVHNHTALVAWVAWQSQRASELLDFATHPQQ